MAASELPVRLSDDALQERSVRDAVEVAVPGAEGYGGVAELLDGTLDAVHEDLISHGEAFLYVAAGGDVTGEGGEALGQNEGGDEADGGEQDDGQERRRRCA